TVTSVRHQAFLSAKTRPPTSALSFPKDLSNGVPLKGPSTTLQRDDCIIEIAYLDRTGVEQISADKPYTVRVFGIQVPYGSSKIKYQFLRNPTFRSQPNLYYSGERLVAAYSSTVQAVSIRKPTFTEQLSDMVFTKESGILATIISLLTGLLASSKKVIGKG